MMKIYFALKLLMQKRPKLVLFIFLFIEALLFQYPQILTFPVQSSHLWRQSDGLSMTLNYYQNGFDFFHPTIHHIINDNGETISELPLIYYVVAFIWKFTGPADGVFRATVMLFFFAFLFNVFDIALMFLKNRFYALWVSVIIFSFPNLFYFGSGFLMDIPSLAFAAIGIKYYLRFLNLKTNYNRYLIPGAIAFCFAILFKGNAAISIGGIGLTTWILYFFYRTKMEFSVRKFLLSNLSFLLILLSSVLWYSYSRSYNELHHTDYFATKVRYGWSFWETTLMEKMDAARLAWNCIPELYGVSNFIFLIFSAGISVLYFRRVSYILKILFLSTAFFATCFYLYVFIGFNGNIYYYINFMMLPVYLLIASFSIIENMPERPRQVINYFSGICIFCSVVIGITMVYQYYYKGRLDRRTNEAMYEKGFRERVMAVIPDHNIKVISVPDECPNYTLYLLNQKGVSNYAFNIPNEEQLKYYIAKRFHYLVINDTNYYNQYDVLKTYSGELKMDYKGVRIYELKK